MMSQSRLTILRFFGRKLSVIALLFLSAVAFATLGDGKSKSSTPKSSLLTNKTTLNPGSFSLKSGYSFRGNQVINNNSEKKFIQLNTIVSVQKGNITYILPLKKKAMLNNVKIDISNRQLRRN
jgi:hypothetical protein